ncbi:hypothetical protein BN2497_131 [Janthinobacterium sp. CG23_2]|nr:hypothetical protein BN2497_131 [Janthinobacterium sp. CG23_2]CUU26463.1 hypothetical protein BN3177_131 [Janthinobacterium sp. CG23_2]
MGAPACMVIVQLSSIFTPEHLEMLAIFNVLIKIPILAWRRWAGTGLCVTNQQQNMSLTFLKWGNKLAAMNSMDILFFTFGLPARCPQRPGPRQCAP